MGWYDETMDIFGAIEKLYYFWELFLNILGFFLGQDKELKYLFIFFLGGGVC